MPKGGTSAAAPPPAGSGVEARLPRPGGGGKGGAQKDLDTEARARSDTSTRSPSTVAPASPPSSWLPGGLEGGGALPRHQPLYWQDTFGGSIA